MNDEACVETKLGRLLCGNAIEYLQDIPNSDRGTAQAVITDPPYGLAVYSTGRKTQSSWCEMENLSSFYRCWFEGCYKVLGADGFFLCFANHRSLPAVYKAMQLCGFEIFDPVVWDKDILGTGMTGFRNVCEFIVVGVKGKAKIRDRSAKNLIRCPWQSHHGKTGHPAEKPLELLTWLVTKTTLPGDLVVDPFMGSGTTAVACESTGRRWLGIELNEEYRRIVARRLAAVHLNIPDMEDAQ